ncbi:MAG: VanZ family protein [Flavobacteriaceae bacterium]|nr:VanZ family protein [Flavobacteriaceae bacterium]
MASFTSIREKRLWLWSLAITITIYSTLFFGQPLATLFEDQNVRAVIFVLVMVLIGTAIMLYSIKTQPSNTEIAVILGVVAVYIMFILRLGMPERSHLMEYSVLAILIHNAIVERLKGGRQIHFPTAFAFLMAFLIGVIDECIQLFIPDRVFDPEDIIFNALAVAMAIGSNVLFSWARKRFKKRKKNYE